MAFEVARTGYQQIDPTFNPGYPYKNKYHNVGQLMTPYEGKAFGTGGDYGPPQRTRYYTVQNPNYPYVMDSQFHPEQFIPGKDGTSCCYPPIPGYSPCEETKYPERFVPPDYFSPQIRTPTGLSVPPRPYPAVVLPGTPQPFGIGVHPEVAPNKNMRLPDPELEYKWSADEYEEYDGDTSMGAEMWNYEKLRTANNGLSNYKSFYPFNTYY